VMAVAHPRSTQHATQHTARHAAHSTPRSTQHATQHDSIRQHPARRALARIPQPAARARTNRLPCQPIAAAFLARPPAASRQPAGVSRGRLLATSY
jgi:hypothetical protein